MYVLVGLGNPGEEYEVTRHNAGRLVLQEVIKELNLPPLIKSAKFGGMISEGAVLGEEVLVLFPDTYMNDSGKVVSKVWSSNEQASLVVVYDDVDLSLGEIKVSIDRGSGGHNGLNSIINETGTKDFIRLRIGISPRGLVESASRPSGDKLSAYVLGKFTKNELTSLMEVTQKATETLKLIFSDGVEKAMMFANQG